MESYRAAGIDIPRTADDQYLWGPRVPANEVEPGDLVFFVGADGTQTAPGHVGLVIGGGMMIEAYSTGFPIRIATYIGRQPIGFSRPWAHAGVGQPAQAAG
jgi:cell wall-associated NlpC family hydrolase